MPAELDLAVAVEMLTTLYAAFGGTKNSRREMIKAAIDMFESDEIVSATGAVSRDERRRP
jgi:hypothetical protein